MFKNKTFEINKVIEMIGESARKLDGKSLLWTGTNGFLGIWVLLVIRYLNLYVLKTPCKLFAYDIKIPPKSLQDEFSNSGIYFRSHDLTTKLLPMSEKIDYVVHMAGIASPYHYKQRPLDTIDVTLEGIRSGLDIARNFNAKFLFTSSSEVYQTASIVPTPESYVGSIPSNNERSCYDVSKLMGENLTYVYGKHFNLQTNIVRIFNSFGPGINEKDSRILPKIASSIVGDFPLFIYKNNELPTRTYCPTGNTIAGIFLTLLNGKKNEIYNIGIDSPEVTVEQLIQIIEKSYNIKVKYEFVLPTSVYLEEPKRRCPDISKAKSEIGYNPKISLEEGIKLFFDWSLQNYQGIQN